MPNVLRTSLRDADLANGDGLGERRSVDRVPFDDRCWTASRHADELDLTVPATSPRLRAARV
jgi:hypothetical protein